MKEDNLTPEHIEWLLSSRHDNQRAALRLFNLFEKYPNTLRRKEIAPIAQTLVAISFSLWRSAFLADKTGKRHAVIEDARSFLGKMLIDNAITYPQDRSAREWTFNYYMNNAKDGLLSLSRRWDSISTVLGAKKKRWKGKTSSERRWDRHQRAFEEAINRFTEYLQTQK